MKNIYSALSLVTLGFFSLSAQAGTHFDSHGNIGYDTLEECHTAIKTGTAKFYQSSSSIKTLAKHIGINPALLAEDSSTSMSAQLISFCIDKEKVEELIDRMIYDYPQIFK